MTCKIFVVGLVFLVFIKLVLSGDIVRELTNRYYDDDMKCVKNGKTYPAYQCSGILIRGVRDIQRNSDRKYPWSLKSSNHKRESFSMAFLRKDTRFHEFPSDYDSGFIMYPHLRTPPGKNTYRVFCAFPIDGHSDGRAGHGCGQSQDDPDGTSRHCDKLNIKSYLKWLSHFERIVRARNYFVRRQCSFDMTTKRATEDFATVIKANTHIRRHSKQYSSRNNELVVHSWNENRAEKLPIEAFFYLLNSRDSYKKAEKYQDDFRRKSNGEVIPIVGIRLPTTSDPNIVVRLHVRRSHGGKKRSTTTQHHG